MGGAKMNFVVTHTHTAAQCPSGNPEMMKVLREVCPSTEFAEKCGVKVLCSWIAVPEHIMYFVLEADSYDSVVKYLEPIMRTGTARVTPVLEYAKAVGLAGK